MNFEVNDNYQESSLDLDERVEMQGRDILSDVKQKMPLRQSEVDKDVHFRLSTLLEKILKESAEETGLDYTSLSDSVVAKTVARSLTHTDNKTTGEYVYKKESSHTRRNLPGEKIKERQIPTY